MFDQGNTLAIRCVVCAVVACWTGSDVRGETRYALEAGGSRTIVATFSFDIHTDHVRAEKWTVYVAEAPALPRQTSVTTTLSLAGTTYEELSPRHAKLLRAIVPVKAGTLEHHLHASVTYHATLHGSRLVERRPKGNYLKPPHLDATEREHCLASTALIDFTNEQFVKWLADNDVRKDRHETKLAYALRLFLHMRKTFKYEYKNEMDRRASYVCRVGISDCGGMSIAYVAALRAHGIPARVLAGRWAKSAKANDMFGSVEYYQQHVKAEFYIDDVGWVPVDLSSSVLHDRSEDGLRYFGNDPGDFLVLHVDPQIVLDTPKFGKETFEWVQGFRYYVNGTGKLDDGKTSESWTVERVR
jgi:transglutaminase-like putative cysteine protease